MDLSNRTPRAQVEPLTPGEYAVACVSALPGVSAAGNKMIVWCFRLPNGQCLFWYTVLRRVETGLTAQALGLPRKPLVLSDAEGRQCRATLAKDGNLVKIVSVRPL